jgi:hypothetical protein
MKHSCTILCCSNNNATLLVSDIEQWFPTCGMRTPHQKKKGVKIKTQKQSYEVLVYKERIM